MSSMTPTDVLYQHLEKKYQLPILHCTLSSDLFEEVGMNSYEAKTTFDVLHPMCSSYMFVVLRSGFEDHEVYRDLIMHALCEKGYASRILDARDCDSLALCAEKTKDLCFPRRHIKMHDQVVMTKLMENGIVPSCYSIAHSVENGRHVCRVSYTGEDCQPTLYATLTWLSMRKCSVHYEGESMRQDEIFIADSYLQDFASSKETVTEKTSAKERTATPYPMSPRPSSLTSSPWEDVSNENVSAREDTSNKSVSSWMGSRERTSSPLPTVSQIPSFSPRIPAVDQRSPSPLPTVSQIPSSPRSSPPVSFQATTPRRESRDFSQTFSPAMTSPRKNFSTTPPGQLSPIQEFQGYSQSSPSPRTSDRSGTSRTSSVLALNPDDARLPSPRERSQSPRSPSPSPRNQFVDSSSSPRERSQSPRSPSPSPRERSQSSGDYVAADEVETYLSRSPSPLDRTPYASTDMGRNIVFRPVSSTGFSPVPQTPLSDFSSSRTNLSPRQQYGNQSVSPVNAIPNLVDSVDFFSD